MVAEAFADVERAVASQVDADPDAVEFGYETKLLRPAELTLGRLYREATAAAGDGFDPVAREVRPGLGGRLAGLVGLGSGDRVAPEFSALIRDVEAAERVTELVVVALLDGDMRDAMNDEEYGDFETALDGIDGRELARIAQGALEEDVERTFDRYPDGVRDAYDRAVEVSEAHQDEDDRYRELLEEARAGAPGGDARIREAYRDATFDDPPEYFETDDVELPYLRTQYGRVGVIYEGMIEMYREAGIEIDDAFERSIVLSIVGAQIWLDDVDDFEADMREGQLTPVTAEYLLADSEAAAYRRVVSITDRYLAAARRHAVESGATLTAIAVEYIRHSGDPSVLPGSESLDGEGTASGERVEVGDDVENGRPDEGADGDRRDRPAGSS